jgi:hypothetical protein
MWLNPMDQVSFRPDRLVDSIAPRFCKLFWATETLDERVMESGLRRLRREGELSREH